MAILSFPTPDRDPAVPIRDETDIDVAAVQAVIADAFARTPYSDGSEPRIMADLRAAGAAVVSLVAEDAGGIAGQVVFSPVTVDGRPSAWHALGPLSVRPDRQRRGIGSSLVEAGLARLRGLGSEGCVLLGNPAYYRRFGFRRDDRLDAPGLPAEYFQVLPFGDAIPVGAVGFHAAFGVSG